MNERDRYDYYRGYSVYVGTQYFILKNSTGYLLSRKIVHLYKIVRSKLQ